MAKIPIGPPVDIYGAFARFNYEPWTALAEFVDNSIQSFVDNRKRLLQEPFYQNYVSVHITFDPNNQRVLILDDAAGIPISEFPRAFRVAVPPGNTKGLNEFGMGMKCAAFWFTRSWSLRTRHLGDTIERNVVLDLDTICAEQTGFVDASEGEAQTGWHGTNIALKKVGDRLPRGAKVKKVRKYLADIYRVPIREGTLKLLVDGEECEYEEPNVLVAPAYDNAHVPSGPAVKWKKEINIELPGGRRISGFAAIFAKGDRANAGFTMFRRDRVVDGFPGARWMPEEIFGAKNSFESMRIFGELHAEGFSVSTQKDKLDWSGLEDDFRDLLKEQLKLAPIPISKQARLFRANPIDSLPQDKIISVLVDATEKTAGAIGASGGAVPPHKINGDEMGGQPAVHPPLKELVIKERKIEVAFEGDDWIVEIQFPKQGIPGKWLDVRGASDDLRDSDGSRLLQIRIALDHPFSRNFIRMEQECLDPVLRIAAALALAERLARLAGVETPGVIRSRMNEVLSQALGNSVEE